MRKSRASASVGLERGWRVVLEDHQKQRADQEIIIITRSGWCLEGLKTHLAMLCCSCFVESYLVLQKLMMIMERSIINSKGYLLLINLFLLVWFLFVYDIFNLIPFSSALFPLLVLIWCGYGTEDCACVLYWSALSTKYKIWLSVSDIYIYIYFH